MFLITQQKLIKVMRKGSKIKYKTQETSEDQKTAT